MMEGLLFMTLLKGELLMYVCSYLVEDGGLDINYEYQDENQHRRTPHSLTAQNGNTEV
jgi:hypothetical protein